MDNNGFDISEHPDFAKAVAAVPTETLGAAAEGFGRGAFTHGYSAVEEKSGIQNRESIEARKEAHPFVAGGSEFLGEALRTMASVAVAGPAALYANAALNTAGQVADEAYNHDPSLTREHVAHIALVQLLTAGFAHSLPAVISGIAASGRAVMSTTSKLGQKLLADSPQLTKIARQGNLLDLSEEALQKGIYTAGRTKGLQAAEEQINSIGRKMGVIQDLADSAAVVPPEEGRGLATMFRQSAEQLKAVRTKGVVSQLHSLQRDVTNGSPSVLLRAEQRIGDLQGEAAAVEDGYTGAVLDRLRQSVKTANDQMLGNHGIHAAGYRDLQQQLLSQVALKKSIPAVGLPELGKLATAGLAAGAGEMAASSVGLPGWAGAAVGATIKGALSPGTRAAAKDVARLGAGAALQGAYKAGRAFSNFDKGIFAQHLGLLAESAAEQTARSGAVRSVALPSVNGLLELISGYTKNPDAYHAQVNAHLNEAPLPDAFKDLGAQDTKLAMQLLQNALPPRITAPNPLGAPPERKLTSTEALKLQHTARGLLDPHAELANPTPDGLAAVKVAYKGTYQAFVSHLLRHSVGPNTSIASPMRRLLGAHGLDTSLREAGSIAQQVYAAPTPAPVGAQRSASPGGGADSKPQRTQTHNESVQQGEP